MPSISPKREPQSLELISWLRLYEKLKREDCKRECANRISFMGAMRNQLPFLDDYFDLVAKISIRHHLDIKWAYEEIVRVLKSEGHGIFLEPLGHNPLINYFMVHKPNLKSIDEHPLFYFTKRLIWPENFSQ